MILILKTKIIKLSWFEEDIAPNGEPLRNLVKDILLFFE
jgi:hypothetical protein